VVALYYVAAALSLLGSRIQPETDSASSRGCPMSPPTRGVSSAGGCPAT
jgi:hypothetical protein